MGITPMAEQLTLPLRDPRPLYRRLLDWLLYFPNSLA